MVEVEVEVEVEVAEGFPHVDGIPQLQVALKHALVLTSIRCKIYALTYYN
jgi:hypothetical protein